MLSDVGMVDRQGDVDLRFGQVSTPNQHFGLAWKPSHSAYLSTYEDGTDRLY